MSSRHVLPTRRMFRVVNGGTPAADPENWDGQISWATPADLSTVDGGYLVGTWRTLTDRGLALGSRSVSAGSLIVSTRAPIGYVAETTQTTAFNQGCRGLIPLKDLDVRYFRYQFLSIAERLAAQGLGSTFMELSTEGLATTLLTVPRLDQQHAVAGYLDAETARIDALITKKRRMIELVQERARATISARLEPRSYSRMVRLGAVSTVQSGLTVDAGRTLDGSSVSRPYLRVANVQDGRIDLTEVKEVQIPLALASRFELKRGDVLMTEGGDPDKLGRGAVWRGQVQGCLHQNHIFAVRPTEALLPEFLALVTRTAYARIYFETTASKTTGIASTSSSKIASFKVPLPDINEQRTTVNQVSADLVRLDRLARLVDCQILLLQEHRQALITAAVTGDLEVPGVAR